MELEQILSVLRTLLRAQEVVLAVNRAYIASAAQSDAARTEPPFLLQGSYRNMNAIAERIVPVMSNAEVEALIDDHYRGEAQAFASGAEANLLKLAELRGRMTEEQRARRRGWWAVYDDVLGRGALTGLEAGASQIRTVELVVIPGLLQTPDYARAVIRADGVGDEAEVSRRVEARMLRQRILAGPDTPEFWAIIDVAALRKADTAQLQHLLDVQHNTLQVRILPDDVGPHAAISGGFTLLDFDDEATVVYTENPVTQNLTDDPAQVRDWEQVYQYVSASALSVEESRTLLQDLIDDRP